MKRKALAVVLAALGFSAALSGAILTSDQSKRDDSYVKDLIDTFLISTVLAGAVATLTLVIDGLLGRRK